MNTPQAAEGRRPPSTPEGRVLRDARILAGLTADEAADRAGIKRSTYGNLERGRQGGRQGAYRAEPATVALACTALGVTAQQMEEAGRDDVAAILRGGLPAGAAASRPALALVPDKLGDDMIEKWIASQEDEYHRNVLLWRWRETDAEGRLLPREVRVKGVVYWALNFIPGPGGPSAQDARHAPGNVS